MKVQDNYGSRIFFPVEKWKKNTNRKVFPDLKTFQFFSSAKLARNNEIANQSNLFWSREYFEKKKIEKTDIVF